MLVRIMNELNGEIVGLRLCRFRMWYVIVKVKLLKVLCRIMFWYFGCGCDNSGYLLEVD